jgi:hypothetical protein
VADEVWSTSAFVAGEALQPQALLVVSEEALALIELSTPALLLVR